MRTYLLFTAAILAAGCRGSGYGPTAPMPYAETAGHPPSAHQAASASPASRLAPPDLARIRRATARFHDVRYAVAAGYVDINVVLPNMGRHLLNPRLLDGRFEADRPELLVYRNGANGALDLVAVEYAVPLDSSATAPEGFDGSADQWVANHEFNLWTLHAWIWEDNPDGVFNPTNRRVP